MLSRLSKTIEGSVHWEHIGAVTNAVCDVQYAASETTAASGTAEVVDLSLTSTSRFLVSPFKFLNPWRESCWFSVDPGVGSQRREGSSKDSPWCFRDSSQVRQGNGGEPGG